MSRYWPHTAYAEDQPYGRAILTVHVLDRTFQTGAFVGALTSLTRSMILRKPLGSTLLASTGWGALIATATMIPGLPMYMSGKTDIEWKDRSWRLLENEGQKEVDDWCSVGFVGGIVAAVRREGWRVWGRGRIVRLVGGAAIGELVGVVGYMGWRYGINGGVWPEKEK